jgi:pilus assembly protein CpaB
MQRFPDSAGGMPGWRRIMKNKIIPIVSVFIGVIAFILTYEYLSSKQKEYQKLKDDIARGTRQVSVVAAAHTIPGGTAIAAEDLKLIAIPEAFVPEQAMMPEDNIRGMVLGKKTLLEVGADKPLLWSNIEGGSEAGQGLAPTIVHRMRAISLSIGGAAAVSGMVQPGDRVDVLGTFTFPGKTPGDMETTTLTVLQDVTILATGQTLAKEKVFAGKRAGSSNYSTVTVQVTPREAELLVFSQQMRGNLTLALRNPKDSYYEPELPEVDYSKLKSELPILNKYRQETIWGKR